jgi:chemotaxis protein MotB
MKLRKLITAVNAVGERNQRRLEEKPTRSPDDDSNWLVSYADMMTLLCGFFIMLFSMSKLDTPKYESFKVELSKQFGGEYHVPAPQEMSRLASQILQELGMDRRAIVKWDPLGISVVFESTAFFDTLSSEVKAEGQIALSRLIELVAQRQELQGKQFKIVVEGHTDSRPILGGVYPSNWELSSARASKVVRMFLARGFAAGNLTAIGYADTRPSAESRTSSGELNEDALAKNRRVVLRILEPNVDSIPFADEDLTVRSPAQVPANTAH